MILSDIRKYIKSRGRASLDDLAAHFDGDKSAIEGMMETLKARGLVVELGCGGCGGSTGCATAGPKVYADVAKGRIEKLDDGSSVCSSPSS